MFFLCQDCEEHRREHECNVTYCGCEMRSLNRNNAVCNPIGGKVCCESMGGGLGRGTMHRKCKFTTKMNDLSYYGLLRTKCCPSHDGTVVDPPPTLKVEILPILYLFWSSPHMPLTWPQISWSGCWRLILMSDTQRLRSPYLTSFLFSLQKHPNDNLLWKVLWFLDNTPVSFNSGHISQTHEL